MKTRFFIAMILLLTLTSCSEVARDMGLEEVPDVQLRSGITGTQDHPTALDPFKRYDLVMAANECRFFTMKVPHKWFWKVFLTVVSRKENAQGRLMSEIAQPDPPWAQLPATTFGRTFVLTHEGDQGVLGVGNNDDTRVALLRLCQEGAPVNVTIESQISATSDLLGPDLKNSDLLKDN